MAESSLQPINEKAIMGPECNCTMPSSYMLYLLARCFAGLLTVGAVISLTFFTCFWDSVPPIELPCPALIWELFPFLIVSHFVDDSLMPFLFWRETEISGSWGKQAGFRVVGGETVVGMGEKSLFSINRDIFEGTLL